MFTMPPAKYRKKYYVVVGMFPGQDWYLNNAENEHDTTVRTWVAAPGKAIKFKSANEAEQIGGLVCDEDDFMVEGFIEFTT